MKQIYELSKAWTAITYKKWTIDDEGNQTLDHTQVRTFSGLPTLEEVIAEAKTRVDEGIEVQVLGELK